MNGLARPPVAMPPLSCAHGLVSWMSQNWPSADGTRVTASSRAIAIAAAIAAAKAALKNPHPRILQTFADADGVMPKLRRKVSVKWLWLLKPEVERDVDQVDAGFADPLEGGAKAQLIAIGVQRESRARLEDAREMEHRALDLAGDVRRATGCP